jgi:ATP-dependent DNA helicase RecG
VKLDDIKNTISTIAGVGPVAVKLFAALNVFTVSDLLKFYPRDYEDRTKRIPLSSFETHKVHTIARVISHEWFGYGRMKTLKIAIYDGTAQAELIAFNRAFLEKALPVNSIISVTGSFYVKYNALQSTAFEATKLSDAGNLEDFANTILPDSGIIPIYHLTQGLTQKSVRKAIAAAITQYLHGIDNDLPEDIIRKHQLLNKTQSILQIHQSKTLEMAQEARRTLIFEELFLFQCIIARRTFEHKGTLTPNTEEQQSAISEIKDFSPKQKALIDRLPYKLTQDQIDAINQINLDIDKGEVERSKMYKLPITETPKAPYTMARLLQGDVGSGKTLVAFFGALRIIDWGGQCAFMAPTEVLAKQHAENAAKMLEGIGVRTAFLTGNVKSTGRKELLKALKNGDIDILIGTHALFSAQTVYKDLQLAVIDEQHKFGVLQRQAIVEKGRQLIVKSSNFFVSPHLLMISATPIPQTLALTAFGDLDVSVIKTMPQGRKPITTYLVQEGHEENAYNAVRKELQKGHQAYFVYPAIEADASNNFDNNETNENSSGLKSAEEAFMNLSKKIYPEFKTALIHSQVPEEEQSKIIKDFHDGKIQILFATTVIEVGVDVSNATCMVIEQADRFGLSQLHQLRGRVGRGVDQSYCFLIYRKNITETGIERMKILRQNTDGFVIAQEDLKLRGPGEITGTSQSGNLCLSIADLNRDYDALLEARKDAFAFMQRTLQYGGF